MPLNFTYHPFGDLSVKNPWDVAMSNLGQVQKLRQQQLANKAAAAREPLIAPTMQAQLDILKARPELMQSQIDVARDKMEHPEKYSGLQQSQIVQTPQGYMRVNKQTGQVEPLTGPAGKPIMPLRSQGTNISFDPSTGQFKITQGGIAPVGEQAQPGGAVTSPGSPMRSRSTGGRTYIDPQTGQAVTVPTIQTVQGFQNALAGEQLVKPMLNQMFRQIAPELGAKHLAERTLGPWARSLGMKTPTLDAYQSAMRGLVPQSSEQFLKAYNLGTGSENRQAMEAAVRPRSDDTAESYSKRIADSLSQILMREKKYRQFLKQGMALQDIPERDISQVLSNQIQTQLLNSLQQHHANQMDTAINRSAIEEELKRRGIK